MLLNYPENFNLYTAHAEEIKRIKIPEINLKKKLKHISHTLLMRRTFKKNPA